MRVYAVSYGIGHRQGDGLAIFSTKEGAEGCLRVFAGIGYPLSGFIRELDVDPDVELVATMLKNM